MTRKALADVLAETRLLLARTENDFSWSHWDNANDALAEIDIFQRHVEAADKIDLL